MGRNLVCNLSSNRKNLLAIETQKTRQWRERGKIIAILSQCQEVLVDDTVQRHCTLVGWVILNLFVFKS